MIFMSDFASISCPQSSPPHHPTLIIFSGNFSYRKAGWVLHMLRHVVGTATFYDILAAYRAEFQGSAATTADQISIHTRRSVSR